MPTLASFRDGPSRPTTSHLLAAALTVAVALVAGAVLVGPGLAALALAGGVVGALATVVCSSRTPLVRGLGGILAVSLSLLVAVPTTLGLGLALERGGLLAALAVWALVYAGFAAALVSWTGVGTGGVRRGGTGAALAAMGVGSVVVAAALPSGTVRGRAVGAGSSLLGWFAGLVAGEGSWALVTLVIFVLLALVLAERALAVVPADRLLPPDRHRRAAEVTHRLERALARARWLALASLALVLVAPLAFGPEDAGSLVSPAWLEATLGWPGFALATLASATALRVLVCAFALVAAGVLLADWSRRTARRGLASALSLLLAPAVGGVLVGTVLSRSLADPATAGALESALVALFPAAFTPLLTAVPTVALVAGALTLATLSLSSVALTVTWLRVLRLLPSRAMAGAVAAGALFVLGVGFAAVGHVTMAVLTAAGAVVVWDLGEYAETLRTELGVGAPTRRAALVHGGATALAALLVAAAALVLACIAAVAPNAGDGALAAAAVAAGVACVVVVAWAVRG